MYPKDNIFNIYNTIGNRVPFLVKRSANGRGVSDIKYRYSIEGYTFMVERVELREGNSKAFGYCMVDGIRDDFCVRKYYPDNKGEIPNAGCEGWVLINIPNVNMDEVFPVHKADDKLSFGRYKGKTFLEVYKENPKYLLWLMDTDPHFKIDFYSLAGVSAEDNNITEKLLSDFGNVPRITIDDIIPMGKYKGLSYKQVYKKDPKYINWMINNVTNIDFDIASFAEMMREDE